MLASCVMFAQVNNSRLNVKYLKLIDNDTEASRARKTDGNGDKCALVKIQTPNMGEADRNRLEFSADMGTFTYPEKATGEVKLFLTEGCKTLIIMHPEYGKLIYPMPVSVQGFKTYEMVLEAKGVVPEPDIVISSNYVLVKATPSDALISIDGNFYPDGSAYISVDEPHDLVVSRSLYHDYEKTIYASSKETMTYEVNLAPAFGWLLIDSSPESGATILVNGVRKGVTPYKSDTLASGEYEVTLMREMYENVTKTVRVVDNNVSEISIPMKPNFANVTVSTDNESDIYIDGKLSGRGKWTGRLTQGTHKLEARKASHRTTAMALEITAGKDESVKLDAPMPIYGALNVTSSPVEASVFLDGAEIGKTPFVNNKVLIGSHELRFVKQGCAPLVKTITIEEGKMTEVNEKLDSGKEANISERPDSGKMITITTGRSGDVIFVDDVLAGRSPLEISMGYGMHKVMAVRAGGKVEKEINVRIGGPTSLTLEFGEKAETPSNWESNGVNFLLLNGAFSTAPQTSFGLTVGQVKQWGWYASVMTNFNFSKADLTCDENGLIEGEDAPLTYSFKEKVTSRWSVTAGGLCKLGCPLYLYAGVGYGKRTLLWKTNDGRLAEPPSGAYKGVSFDAGLMAHIKGFSVSAGVTTIGTGYMEFKAGIGFCLKSGK